MMMKSSEDNDRLNKLNNDCYYLQLEKNKIEQSLAKKDFDFDPDKAAQLFREANIFFEGQIKKSYEDLIDFNKSITNDRHKYYKKRLKEIKHNLEMIEIEKKQLSSCTSL